MSVRSTLLTAWLAASATSALWLTESPHAHAQGTDLEAEARLHFQAGEVAFQSGRFESALESFRHAYDLTHRPQLLYNIGLAAERLRRDTEALAAFERFLAEVPDASNRSQIEARMEIMRRSAADSAARADSSRAEEARMAEARAEAARAEAARAEAVARAEAARAEAARAEADRAAAARSEAEAQRRSSADAAAESRPGEPERVAAERAAPAPTRWPWYLGGGIALAGGVGGLIAGASLSGQIDTCDTAIRAGGTCSNRDELVHRRSLAYGAGAGASGAGVALLVVGITRSGGTDGAQASWACVPGIASVACAGRF